MSAAFRGVEQFLRKNGMHHDVIDIRAFYGDALGDAANLTKAEAFVKLPRGGVFLVHPEQRNDRALRFCTCERALQQRIGGARPACILPYNFRSPAGR